MTCIQARERILESLDEAAGRHCSECAALLEAQLALDAALAAQYPSVTLPNKSAEAIRLAIRDRRRAARWEAIPDLLQAGGCAALALLATILIPSAPGAVILFTAVLSYAAQSALRSWIEEA